MESNGSERGRWLSENRMEWNGNRIEHREGVSQGKEVELTRRWYRPTGGWAMRVSQQSIVSGILAEQVDQADRSRDS